MRKKEKKFLTEFPQTLCPLNKTAESLTSHPEGPNFQEIEMAVSYVTEVT